METKQIICKLSTNTVIDLSQVKYMETYYSKEQITKTAKFTIKNFCRFITGHKLIDFNIITIPSCTRLEIRYKSDRHEVLYWYNTNKEAYDLQFNNWIEIWKQNQ